MLKWIHERLQQRLDRKKQEVVRLRWQQAQLRQRLEQEKKKNGIDGPG